MSLKTALKVMACAIAMTAATETLADSRVTIHNDTGVTLYRFYSTNSGSTRWGSDVMGTTTLPSGRSMSLNFANSKGYCLFDFRAIFADGSELTRAKVNVCEISDYYYTP